MRAALPALRSGAIVAFAVLAVTPAARAQVPADPTDGVPSTGAAAITGPPEAFGGTGAQPRPAPTRASPYPVGHHPRNGRRCTRISRARTCTTYRGGRAVRVSVAAAARDEGWWAGPGPSPMGRLWITVGTSVRGLCTGTLTTPNIVITAGHCLWNDGTVAPGLPRGYLSPRARLTFVPGNAFAANGARGAVRTAATPYGSWPVARTYVPACWARQRDPHCDIGLAVLRPVRGRRAGEVAGTFAAWTNSCCAVGEEVVDGGYPATAPRFVTYAGGYGNAPYFCRMRLTARSAVAAGTGTLQLLGCNKTRGGDGHSAAARLQHDRRRVRRPGLDTVHRRRVPHGRHQHPPRRRPGAPE